LECNRVEKLSSSSCLKVVSSSFLEISSRDDFLEETIFTLSSKGLTTALLRLETNSFEGGVFSKVAEGQVVVSSKGAAAMAILLGSSSFSCMLLIVLRNNACSLSSSSKS
jgi:hypothetical protein